jgi:hypothetical protein
VGWCGWRELSELHAALHDPTVRPFFPAAFALDYSHARNLSNGTGEGLLAPADSSDDNVPGDMKADSTRPLQPASPTPPSEIRSTSSTALHDGNTKLAPLSHALGSALSPSHSIFHSDDMQGESDASALKRTRRRYQTLLTAADGAGKPPPPLSNSAHEPEKAPPPGEVPEGKTTLSVDLPAKAGESGGDYDPSSADNNTITIRSSPTSASSVTVPEAELVFPGEITALHSSATGADGAETKISHHGGAGAGSRAFEIISADGVGPAAASEGGSGESVDGGRSSTESAVRAADGPDPLAAASASEGTRPLSSRPRPHSPLQAPPTHTLLPRESEAGPADTHPADPPPSQLLLRPHSAVGADKSDPLNGPGPGPGAHSPVQRGRGLCPADPTDPDPADPVLADPLALLAECGEPTRALPSASDGVFAASTAKAAAGPNKPSEPSEAKKADPLGPSNTRHATFDIRHSTFA